VWMLAAGALLVAGCSDARVDPPVATEPGPGSSPPPAIGDPVIASEDRNPIPEKTNALNSEPVVGNETVLPEIDQLRTEYLIPESVESARMGVRDAARAFATALAAGIEDPEPSSLNIRVPGHAFPVALPAGMNILGRAALHNRNGATGVDVGPSLPDATGRVWVAVFLGASGPLGGVEAHCVGVTLRSEGAGVIVELVELDAIILRQPTTRKEFPASSCTLDLSSPPDNGFVPQS